MALAALQQRQQQQAAAQQAAALAAQQQHAWRREQAAAAGRASFETTLSAPGRVEPQVRASTGAAALFQGGPSAATNAAIRQMLCASLEGVLSAPPKQKAVEPQVGGFSGLSGFDRVPNCKMSRHALDRIHAGTGRIVKTRRLASCRSAVMGTGHAAQYSYKAWVKGAGWSKALSALLET